MSNDTFETWARQHHPYMFDAELDEAAQLAKIAALQAWNASRQPLVAELERLRSVLQQTAILGREVRRIAQQMLDGTTRAQPAAGQATNAAEQGLTAVANQVTARESMLKSIVCPKRDFQTPSLPRREQAAAPSMPSVLTPAHHDLIRLLAEQSAETWLLQQASMPPKPAQLPLTHCAANRDGDCDHQQCPQLRDGEPVKSGRRCPLDTQNPEDDH